MLEEALNFVPVYVLVLFRIAGMMIYAPLLGSDRIPKRIKALMACVLAAGIAPNVSLTVQFPQTSWQLAVAIGGEIAFGLAIGTILSMIFIAAQWAGGMIGQQMGLNLGQTFDPQFGATGSFIGDLYFFLTLVVFLVINGSHALILGVRDSFSTLPLLSVGANAHLVSLVMDMFQTATLLAIQLAAPMLVTMLIVDLILGFIGKTVPQMNIMTAGIGLRVMVGMAVVIFGLSMTSGVLRDALSDAMRQVHFTYMGQ
ncbi:MAG: flagellar biosynthetic protein FliR [Tepidisphaeraceae bacterium]|jgi:flagellar biosynthetic protein FliR